MSNLLAQLSVPLHNKQMSQLVAYSGNICVELFHVMNVGVGSQHKGSHQDKQKKDLSCFTGGDDDNDGDDCNNGGCRC